MQVGLMVIPIKLESESLPLCILDLRHNKSKAPQNKKNKKILNHDHLLIGRTQNMRQFDIVLLIIHSLKKMLLFACVDVVCCF